MNNSIKEEIIKLKEEKNAVILAHFYQSEEIQDVADYVGDSYYLSKICRECNENIVVFCGVKFMVESAKILSPNKRILFPCTSATCPMADMATKDQVLKLKKKHPNAKVISYINSSAEVKAVSDVCCTSSSAIKIINNINSNEIIFLPDKNLGSYIQEKIPNKKIILWDGYCNIHDKIKALDIIKAKEKYGQDIKVLVHPECKKEVRDLADFIGSTKNIIDFSLKDKEKKYLVVTEYGVGYDLKRKNPSKEFYFLNMCCSNMKKISLKDVYECLKNTSYELNIDKYISKQASRALEEMHILGA